MKFHKKTNQISKQGLLNDPWTVCSLLRLNGYVNLFQLNSDGILFMFLYNLHSTPLKRSSKHHSGPPANFSVFVKKIN